MKTKMKNKYVLPILLIGTVGLQGCSDFLALNRRKVSLKQLFGKRRVPLMHSLSAIMVTHTGHTKVSPHGTKLSVTIW